MAEASYYYGTGKRKTAVAQVRLYTGEDQVTVNGEPLADVFPNPGLQQYILEPLKLAGLPSRYDVVAKVAGGGFVSQAGALRLGIARGLAKVNEEVRTEVSHAGMLTRDPRVKERKKYGLKRARKAPQYTKR
ncbi:MAG: 30S ribosomal protein S9 [Chloroflexi bacterium]|nr:30S ribosomal protein S9 [Chloroflexota bacterium]